MEISRSRRVIFGADTGRRPGIKAVLRTAAATALALTAGALTAGALSAGALSVGALSAGAAHAAPINGGIEAPVPDVFYNFYAPAVPAGEYPGSGAQLYVSPRPVPPRVGHTWYTYPPFMPHEFLYKHRRRYTRPAGATGMRTDVHAYWW